ncbi:MAG: pyridoxal phosphate-dependent aminotransferase [bacterium]|nr:pyridoxal phosphate-dependent aminotransferase [bacterium]
METVWNGIWRGLDLRLERRRLADGGGPSLRVLAADAAGALREWVRFDAFERQPHWHLDPNGTDEVRPLDERVDPIAESFELLSRDPATLLERAGAPAGVVQPSAGASETVVLREAERAMRHRPAVLDELDPVLLRNRRSEKWHTYPADVLPAWVAEMDFPIAAPIHDELRRFVDSGDVGYPLGLRQTGLPDVFCERMTERFGWEPDVRRVEVLSEVVQGMYVALEAYSEPGDGVVVQTPIYPPFLGSVRDMKRTLVENRMRLEGDRLEFDLDALEASVTPGCRLLLFCNPHNPSGRVHTREELERVAALAVEHDLVVVSDEIHADLLYDGREHIPFATLSPEVAARTVTLTSASKAFNIPGLRTAIAHFGDHALQRRFNTVLHRHIRGGIGLFGLYATMAAWRWAQPWLDEVVPYLAGNRDFVAERLAERLPEVTFLRPEATYLAWLDCRGLALDGPPAAYFMRNGQVALSEGSLFGPGWEGFVRLNLGTSRPILAEVIDRMAKALGR